MYNPQITTTLTIFIHHNQLTLIQQQLQQYFNTPITSINKSPKTGQQHTFTTTLQQLTNFITTTDYPLTNFTIKQHTPF